MGGDGSGDGATTPPPPATPDAEAPPAKAPFDLRHWLPFAGLVVAVWGSLPYYSGPGPPRFVTDASVEFANHVVPAVAVALASIWVLLARRRPSGAGAAPFFAGMVVLLAGLFVVATHAPLVAQAFSDEAPWDAAIFHSSTALATFGLGLLWSVAHWSDLSEIEEAGKAKKAKP